MSILIADRVPVLNALSNTAFADHLPVGAASKAMFGLDGNPGLVLAKAGEKVSELAARVGVGPGDILYNNPGVFGVAPGPIDPIIKADVWLLTAPLPPVQPPKTDKALAGEGLWNFAKRQLEQGGITNPTAEQITVAQNSIARLNRFQDLSPVLHGGQDVIISGAEAASVLIGTQLTDRLEYAFEKLSDGLGADVVQALKDNLKAMAAGLAVFGAAYMALLFLGPPGWAAQAVTLATLVGTLAVYGIGAKAATSFLMFLTAVGMADSASHVDKIVDAYKETGVASDIVNVGLIVAGGAAGKAYNALKGKGGGVAEPVPPRPMRTEPAPPPARGGYSEAIVEEASVANQAERSALRDELSDIYGRVNAHGTSQHSPYLKAYEELVFEMFRQPPGMGGTSVYNDGLLHYVRANYQTLRAAAGSSVIGPNAVAKGQYEAMKDLLLARGYDIDVLLGLD